MAPQDTYTVRFAKEIPPAKKQRTSLWTEKNWPRLNKALVNSRYPYVRGQGDEAFLELFLDPVPKKQYLIFYRGLTGRGSNMRMYSLRRRGGFYQKIR